MQISKSECVYQLSERGYANLVKAMDDDRSWDIMDKFIDEYLKFPFQRFLPCESHSKQRKTITIHIIFFLTSAV